MLTDSQSNEVRTALNAAEADLLGRAKDAIEVSREREMDQGRDSIDQSNSEEMLSTHLRLRDREQKLLNKIRQAVARIDDKSIDECEECGDPIGFKRLLARPVTTLCIGCKESAEEQEKRNQGLDETPPDTQ